MPLRTITGNVAYANGTNPTNSRVEFYLNGIHIDEVTIAHSQVFVPVASNGDIVAQLYPNAGGFGANRYNVDLVNYQDAQYTKEIRRVNLGRIYVENTTGQVLQDLLALFSAPAGELSPAEAASLIAIDAAADAAASAAQASLYDGPWVDTVSALLANTALTYTTGTPSTVTTADFVRTRSEGFSYKVQPLVFADPDITTAGGVKLTVESTDGELNVLAFGASPLGAIDSTAAFNRAAARRMRCFVPAGRYRINSPVNLLNFTQFYGVYGGDVATLGGSILLQYGTAMFSGAEDLRWASVSGFSFDYQGAATGPYTVAFALKAHRDCIFEDIRFVRYNNCTIMERIPQNATINSIDNHYRNWVIEACTHVCVTIGQDGWGTSFQGDGVTTIINTGLEWPEVLDSSVSVFRENFGRNYTQLVLGTDYNVSYPSGLLSVTLTGAAAATDRIHIFPSQPRADAAAGRQRRPFSNNHWTKIASNFNFGHAWQDLRWVDAESYDQIRFHAAADQVRAFVANPASDRACEAGDFNSYHDCVMSYVGATDPKTIAGWFLGPGSLQMSGSSIMMDLTWVHGGVNRAISNHDRRSVALTGTVATTSGSTAVVGTGTLFTQQLTLIGDSKDKIEIGGVVYGIASINSATSITLTTNAAATASGQAANRINAKNANSYLFDWANIGTTEYSSYRGGVGKSTFGSSTKFVSTVAVPAAATVLVVPHNLWRAPSLSADEIALTPLSNINIGGVDRTVWVSNITATTVQVNLSAAYGAGPLSFKLILELGPLN